MDKFDRIQQLHRLLRSHHLPIPIKKLAERMECTERTVKRTIETMQLQLDAPIEYRHKASSTSLASPKLPPSPGFNLYCGQLSVDK